MEKSEKRIALITGGSRGLGLALARQLAAKGWGLILDARGETALRSVRDELSRHTWVEAIPGDIGDPSHRQALFQAVQTVGRLDLLVNNAGILGPSPLPALVDLPVEAFQEILSKNTTAVLGMVQLANPYLKPGARIINITSDAAVTPYEGWGGYGASKAALELLSSVLAVENPQWRIYWADPGDMRTQMQQEANPGEDISDRPLPEESLPGLLALIEGNFPSGRYQVKEIEVREI